VTPHGVGRCPKDRGDGLLWSRGRMSAFTAVFFPHPISPKAPPLAIHDAGKVIGNGKKKRFSQSSFSNIYEICHISHRPKRNTSGGKREGKRKPQQKPAFPSLFA